MTAATLDNPRETADAAVVFHDVHWRGYEAILAIRGERSTPRMVYLDGSLFLTSPSYPHERLAGRLDWLVKTILVELDLPCTPAGGTTFRRGSKKGGVEPDASYYFASDPNAGRRRKSISKSTRPQTPVSAAEIHQWATKKIEGSESAWMKAVQRWVRETVAPRWKGSKSKSD